MPVITLRVDEETATRLRKEAERARMPLSHYIVQKLRHQIEWAELVEALSGAYPDFPDPEGLRPREYQETNRSLK